MKRIMIAVAIGLVATSAFAQDKPKPRIQITGDVVKDTKANLGTVASNVPVIGSTSTTASKVCSFNLLAGLKADTLVKQIKDCIQNKLFDDVSAALDSANQFGDKIGIDCLKPGLEIVRAARGTQGSDAVPATDTTPAIAAVAAIDPGPILLYQKFREFELSGGPAACKTWVNSTLQAANPLTN